MEFRNRAIPFYHHGQEVLHKWRLQLCDVDASILRAASIFNSEQRLVWTNKFTAETDYVRLTDTVYVHIPVEQKHYSAPEYDAWVSGYRPSLDSLRIHTQSARITSTIPIPATSKPRRWGIGIQMGYGMTAAPRPEFHPYIGIGISYNILTF